MEGQPLQPIPLILSLSFPRHLLPTTDVKTLPGISAPFNNP